MTKFNYFTTYMSNMKPGHNHLFSFSLVILIPFSYSWFNLYRISCVHEFHRFCNSSLIYLLILSDLYGGFWPLAGIIHLLWIFHLREPYLHAITLLQVWAWFIAWGVPETAIPRLLGQLFHGMVLKPTLNLAPCVTSGCDLGPLVITSKSF